MRARSAPVASRWRFLVHSNAASASKLVTATIKPTARPENPRRPATGTVSATATALVLAVAAIVGGARGVALIPSVGKTSPGLKPLVPP